MFPGCIFPEIPSETLTSPGLEKLCCDLLKAHPADWRSCHSEGLFNSTVFAKSESPVENGGQNPVIYRVSTMVMQDFATIHSIKPIWACCLLNLYCLWGCTSSWRLTQEMNKQWFYIRIADYPLLLEPRCQEEASTLNMKRPFGNLT